ncbi:MAG: hypothetical protein EBX36_01635 [Planctomycetia bacterium]|nr:hypothetical protein [Planctomycetia bacterium]
MRLFSFRSLGLSRKFTRMKRRPGRGRDAIGRLQSAATGQPESLEPRRLLAFDLVAAYAQSATPFFVAGGTTGTAELNEAPRQITLTFSPGTQIDAASLSSSITVTRSGRGDDAFGVLGSYADVPVVPGSIAVDDLPNQNQVILRFADTLPDDTYRITIGDTLKGNSGLNSFRPAPLGATSQSIVLRLDLGAQVVSVVPQPVIRDKSIDVTAMPVDGDLLTVGVRGKPLTIEFDADTVQSRANATVIDIRAGQNDTPAKVAAAIQAVLAPAGTPAAAFGGELAASAAVGTKVTLTGTTFTPVVSFTDRTGAAAARLAIGDGLLTQKRDTLVVHFNANDPLQSATAQNPANYQVFETDPATAATLAVLTPTGVSYDAVSGTAVLSFAAGKIANGKVYRLQVGGGADTNSKLDKAVTVGSIFQQPGAVPAYTTTAFLGEANANDVDLYKVNLTAAGTITVKATPDAGFNPRLRLFDSTGAAITAGVVYTNNATGVAETLTYAAPAGDYLIGVSSTGNESYSAIDGSGAAGGTTTGSYKLEVSSNVAVAAGDNNSSFGTATSLGTLGIAGATVSAQIDARATVPTPAGNLAFPLPPGAVSEPGHRDTPADSGHHGTGGEAVVPAAPIPVRQYNFRADYGVDPQGNPLTNLITEDQKQRAREVFELFSLSTGIRFVETPTSGLTVVTGDMRALNAGTPTDPVNGPIGLGGPGMVVMNSRVDWGSSDEFGGKWFETAMHEIGHALGLAHSYDLPSIMGNGLTGEKVYPGDYDTLHLLQVYPKTGSDIDVFSFTLPSAGRLSAETVVARPGMPATSAADTLLTLYRQDPITGARELVARNDDYYGRDSFLSLDLQAGSYYVAVTSTGNAGFNPEVADSGNGGRTDGRYDLKLGFTPTATADTTIVDAAKGTPLDGDRDGVPGGACNFWFETAARKSTVYVDKAATALTSTSTWLAGATQLTLASVAGLSADMKVSAAGIPAGTLIGSVNAGTKVVTLVDAAGNPVAATVAGRWCRNGSRMPIWRPSSTARLSSRLTTYFSSLLPGSTFSWMAKVQARTWSAIRRILRPSSLAGS